MGATYGNGPTNGSLTPNRKSEALLGARHGHRMVRSQLLLGGCWSDVQGAHHRDDVDLAVGSGQNMNLAACPTERR
jgi:hypothetical protein